MDLRRKLLALGALFLGGGNALADGYPTGSIKDVPTPEAKRSFYMTADGIYWRGDARAPDPVNQSVTRDTDTNTGGVTTTNDNSNTVPSRGSGLRLQAGTDLTRGWSVFARYTRGDVKSADETGLKVTPSTSTTYSNLVSFKTMREFDIIDANLAANLYVSDSIRLQGFGGLQYIRRSFSSLKRLDDGDVAIDGTFVSTRMSNIAVSSDGNNFGLRLGGEVRFALDTNFSITGMGAYSLLASEAPLKTISVSTLPTRTNTTTTLARANGTTSLLELGAQAEYVLPLAGTHAISLRGGYIFLMDDLSGASVPNTTLALNPSPLRNGAHGISAGVGIRW